MLKRKLAIAALISLHVFTASAQQKKAVTSKIVQQGRNDSLIIPVSKADLGTFPYFKTLRNFSAADSLTIENNRVYFFTGKKFFTVDGKVSAQKLNIINDDKATASAFGCIQEFDKVVSALGGIKFFTGKMPEEQLKSFAGEDIISLGGKSQVAASAFYGVAEYVIKTPEKEVWVQLEPYSLDSKFYTLLVAERTTPLLSLNTNKHNQILEDLEKNKKAVAHLSFEPDNVTLLTESKDEILSILGVFQAHPEWKLKLESYNAPVGKAEYTLALTEKRANAIKQELMNLGVKSASIDAKGMGDQKPLASNDTEQGRLTNTRIEIILQ